MATTPKGADDGDSHGRREKDFSPEYLAEIEDSVDKNGVVLTNFHMRKQLEPLPSPASMKEAR